MIEIEGIDPSDVMVLPNGIPAPPPATGGDVRAELGIAPGAPVIGTVSVLRPQKALDVLLRATQALLPEFPALMVLIAGEGDRRFALEDLAKELGIEDSVIFLGVRTDVPDVLAALDVAVSSSDFEGSPLSVMEYMEESKPVVASAVGGIPDLVQDGVTGALVPPREPQRLAEAIARLLANPAESSQMGQRGRELRRERYSIDATVSHLSELYERTAREAGLDA
jgi:glycosyltransferase involved in cell wall biosynthesis